MMLLAVVVFYVVLGCFMETLSMMITTVPIIAPVMQALGFDPVWFGIVVIVLVETALITPPVGPEPVRRAQPAQVGLAERRDRRRLPFVAALFALLACWPSSPGLALWLPSVFGN
jgi:C4-dicarboxylate transporter DctM subunit